MRRPPAKAKRDGNEPDIFAILRAYGLAVYPLDTPCDAVVGYGGRSYLVEVKTPKGKLTATQVAFLGHWSGCHEIIRTDDEAHAFAKRVRAEAVK